jgi:mono/diheme cytochrome c family protein
MRYGWMVLGAAALTVAILLGGGHWSAVAKEKPAAKGPPAALIKRGDYLVNQVARCGDCHTPRDARGRLDNSRLLQGAPIWFTPKNKPREWEDRAPDITARGKAGKWSEDKMIRFFATGKKTDAPMPVYKLSEEDARAVTSYLRSLPGKKKKGGRREKEDND